MIKFREDEKKKVSAAVARAEKNTAGEIVAAVIKQSDSYAIYELIPALSIGLLVYGILSVFHGAVESWLYGWFWEYSGFYLHAFIGTISLLSVLLVYSVINIPMVGRLLIPKMVRIQKVKQRALLHFIEAGMMNTEERTGVLLFLSLGERQVELIADKGIQAKVKAEEWESIVNQLLIQIKNKKPIDGMVEAIGSIGGILSRHFPGKEDDKNELKNDLRVLED